MERGECKKIIEDEGSPSGLYLDFVNRVAEIVEKKHPDKYISTLAYGFTVKPPKTGETVEVKITLEPPQR